MSPRHAFLIAFRRLFVFAFLLSLLSLLPLTATAAAPESPHDDYAAYLPLISNGPAGLIGGFVTDGGVPAVGAQLELRRYNPEFGSWPLLSTVYTDARGHYAFSKLTTLQEG